MRTNEPTTREPWVPLGGRIEKPVPARPEFTPVTGAPHIEQNGRGQLRTNLPLPPKA